MTYFLASARLMTHNTFRLYIKIRFSKVMQGNQIYRLEFLFKHDVHVINKDTKGDFPYCNTSLVTTVFKE